MRPAGFWRRCAAWTLDAALVTLPVLLLCRGAMHRAAATFTQSWGALVDAVAQRMAAMILSPATSASTAPGPGAMTSLARDSLRDPALLAAAADLQSALIGLLWLPMAVFVTLFLAWCVGFERSPLQATPGKRALGLRAVDLAGGRIGTGVALARFLAGTLSWLSLNIGHLLAGLAPDHAALHDRLSRTRVVLAPGAPERMPPWATAWLIVQAVAWLIALAWAAQAMAVPMQAALDRALWG
ncbi:RDD family protein [Luteimonas sp. MJ204]|uniref:RDD family protein n=1 Tax=Luteimonas sp. MJ145 TaxID=3129234 RepID=UPI0031B9EFB0